MKRNSMTPITPWELKRRRISDVEANLDSIRRLQGDLLVIEKKCADHQMEIQRKFDNEKKPLWQHRSELIHGIPDFWKKAIENHPDIKKTPADSLVLDFLEKIQVEDNLDNFGSYKITFSWKDANPYFSEKQIVKSVKFVASSEDGQEISEEISSTPISWAPKKSPLYENDSESFFSWFLENRSKQYDLGEILRRDLWLNPYPYYLNLSPPIDYGNSERQLDESNNK